MVVLLELVLELAATPLLQLAPPQAFFCWTWTLVTAARAAVVPQHWPLRSRVITELTARLTVPTMICQ